MPISDGFGAVYGKMTPRNRAERAHADADYDEETAFDNYFNPEAGHRAGPTNA